MRGGGGGGKGWRRTHGKILRADIRNVQSAERGILSTLTHSSVNILVNKVIQTQARAPLTLTSHTPLPAAVTSTSFASCPFSALP